MPTTQKRIHIALTQEDIRELAILEEYFGENASLVVKRAIAALYLEFFGKK